MRCDHNLKKNQSKNFILISKKISLKIHYFVEVIKKVFKKIIFIDKLLTEFPANSVIFPIIF